MATTHPLIKNVVQRGYSQLDQRFALVAEKLVQVSIPNVARIATDYTGGGTTSPVEATALTITSGVGLDGGFAVVGGRNYGFRAVLPATVNGTSGITITMNAGTCTFTSFAGVGYAYTASAIATLVVSSAASNIVDAATAYTSIILEGSFVASGSGSFGIKVGTHATTTAPLLLAGGYLSLLEMPQ